MEEYQHQIFFEARELTEPEKNKIRRYFQKRRQSGGGDCGSVEKVEDKIYKICFKEKKDHDSVLKRKLHTVCLDFGELHLTVSQTTSLLSTKDEPTTSHSQVFTKANTKTTEKRQPLDVFLMYYLRDNPKASKLLEKQLSAVDCTFELDFDEEEVVVRGEGGAFGGTAEKWEQQVDLVFVEFTERFSCHHVFEAKQVKMLLQDHSLAADDVKVYTESGYAVVVGDVQVVNARIETLTRSVSTSREVPVVQKQFNLVEEEFSREMRANYPEVKITRGSAMIILEGPDKEVQLGETKLNELIKRIKEKRLQLPTDLITFIRLSSAISKYQARFKQSLRHPVSLQVGSDLLLSSLSSDALDEAEAAVMRDLNVESVNLQGAAAVPPDLDRVKEILNKAEDKENSGELRVDVSFIPGSSGTAVTKVQLVGYSVNVNKLKDVLHDYMINQVETQKVLNLLQPVVVDCFDGVSDQADSKASLSRLMSDTLVLNGPGAQLFLQGESNETKELLKKSSQVLIREQQPVYSLSTITVPKVYSRSQYSSISSTSTANMATSRQWSNTTSSTTSVTVNKPVLQIKLGSLVDEQVNVLVAPMISKYLTSTKIGKCLLKKAGSAMQINFDLVSGKTSTNAGNVIEVDAPPSLGCSKIFFIECLPWDGVGGQSIQALGTGLKRCLDLCVQQGWSSVALTVIGPGEALKYPLQEAIQVLTDNIHQFGLSASSGSLSTIHVVIEPNYPDSDECYHDVYRHLSFNMNQGGQAIFRSLTSDLDDLTVTVGGKVKLQVVFGDITNETTDAVVNSTDFTYLQTAVCKAILSVAGSQTEAMLRNATIKRGDVFETLPGAFPCKALLHVWGESDVGVIEQLVCRIIQLCESSGYKSVAIPAICAGIGGLDPSLVAHAITRGIHTTVLSSSLQSLTIIRLVLIKIKVFLAFKKQTLDMFPSAAINT
ncbi:uncharacterized protein LOC125018563 [Mugil cephalus]|uniref:uncharacterized protein LOC125018563 n=1 Tax=Mugil cephalus TaxID=48193 RepID=UPI001FB6605F|nr:uncharacterized protein LOC125018563 [Mugil cephalus]